MAKEPNPPELTDEDRAQFAADLAKGKPLPCGGISWEGHKNAGTPIFRKADRSGQFSARKLKWALDQEAAGLGFNWPAHNLHAEHWGCISHLTPDRRLAAKEPVGPADYVRLWLPQHPLATRAGVVLEHRAVLHDKLGDAAQPCHHCGREVRWDATRGDPAELTVDHLDTDPANNDPANLVPSCRPCNTAKVGRVEVVPAKVAEKNEIVRPISDNLVGEAPTSPNVSDNLGEPQSRNYEGKTRLSEKNGPFEALEQGLSWLQGNRRATVVLVLLGLFLAGLFGTAFMLTSPASFLPGVRTDPHDGPEPTWPATTVLLLPGETATTTGELQPPTTRAASTTTAWTLPEPCTPTHCPSLDD